VVRCSALALRLCLMLTHRLSNSTATFRLLLLICRLQEAVREAEAEGEQLLGQLASGELSVEAFVERYTRAQAQYHQRDLKLQAAQQTLPSLSG